MQTRNLGPHTFKLGQPHPRHHLWLASFTPRERHHLIEEDVEARQAAFTVMAGAMAFGLVTLLATLAAMLTLHLM